MKKKIRVPCSSANLGPGFDVFGLALKASSVITGLQRYSAVLEVQIEELSYGSLAPLNCVIECEGEGSESISRIVDKKYTFIYSSRHDLKLTVLVLSRKSVCTFFVATGCMPSR